MHSGVEHVWGLGTPEGCDGKTKKGMRGVKRSVLTLGVLRVDISADGKMTYQMIYVTEET